MRKSLIVIASALLFGVGAADVGNPKLGYDEEVYAGLVDPEDLRPRPARHNYPACRPGRGDDRCIQLYERGVRERLARWDRSTGGWNGEVRMARAERRGGWRARQHRQRRAQVRARTQEQRVHHQRRMHEQRAHHQRRMQEQRVHQERRVHHGRTEHGVARGGPVERRTGYPRCGAGGGDNCIQMRERAVRGERTGTPGI